MFSKYFIELDQSYGNVLCKTVLLLELSKQSNVVKKCCEVAELRLRVARTKGRVAVPNVSREYRHCLDGEGGSDLCLDFFGGYVHMH